MVPQQRLQGFSNGGIAMQRQQQGRVGMVIKHFQHAFGNALQSITPVFPAMHGGQNHPLIRPIERDIIELRGPLSHAQQGIDHGVSSHHHLAHHTRGQQVLLRLLRWRKVQLSHLRNQTTVRFFWKRIKDVVGAEPGLHMANRDLLIERRKRCCKSGGGVALHQHQ